MTLRKRFNLILACLIFAVSGRVASGTPVKCSIACQTITDVAKEPTFKEPIFRKLAQSGPLNSSFTDNGWHLTRIRNPRGGPDTVSIMHSAEPSEAGVGLAGVALRCITAPDVDTVVFVIVPFPPASHPQVTFRLGAKTATFEASVLEPFTALLLPWGATAFLTQSSSSQMDASVSITIEEAGKVTKGTVPIGGIGSAFNDLLKSCIAP